MGHTVLKTILAISLALIALSPLYLKSPPADFTAGCKDLANELGHSTERCTAQYSPLTSPQEDLSTTLKWCMENRHTGSRYGLRWQHSTTLEWIDPLSAWILSAFGLLLLCPVGDKSEKEIQSQKPRQFATVKVLGDHFHSFIHSLSQFLLILGDPASSFCGVLSEVINDVRYNHFAHDKVGGDENDHQRYCIIINCCALLSQIKYTAKTALPLEFLIECKNSTSHAHDALKGILGGKVKFVSGIILPTVMYCGSCVAVIYDATYTNLGDNGTGEHHCDFFNLVTFGLNQGFALLASLRNMVSLVAFLSGLEQLLWLKPQQRCHQRLLEAHLSASAYDIQESLGNPLGNF
ncbi:hypothetical protein EDC01DRAFT_627603 [Geopyxis carbonaria]|nr:hypothetical protein EDC01DRAFT_627603 [Geopyxis carbonaria]